MTRRATKTAEWRVAQFPLFFVGWFTFSGGRSGWIPLLLAFSALGLVIWLGGTHG
jgi:hypothetical protein